MPNHRVRADLASLRRNKGVSLGEIADSTKIAVRYLEAIEGGHFGKLPGGFYDISYIRQYAQAIGGDEAELLQCYRSSREPDPTIPAHPVPANEPVTRIPSSYRRVRWYDLRIWLAVSMRGLRKI